MMRYFSLLFLFIAGTVCYGQNNRDAAIKDPYYGKPFKPGCIKTLHLQVPVGALNINCTLKYTLLDDPDGLFYSFGHRYKAHIDSAIFSADSKGAIPQGIIDGFTDITVELTGQEIMQKTMRASNMYYWFTTQDFNLDGKPDFAFIGDLGYHSLPVKHYVWVSMNGKLVYWHGLSDVVSDVIDRTTRTIHVQYFNNEKWTTQSYKIEKDTALIQVNLK